MDGNRPAPLSDDALDRELAAACDVDPSPEFLARVRTRIAAEPVARSARLLTPWTSWVAAAAAFVLAAAIVLWPAVGLEDPAATVVETRRSSPQIAAPDHVTPSQDERQAPRPSRETTSAADLRRGMESPRPFPRTTARPIARPVVAEAADEPPFTDVLISEDEVQALRRLVDLATASARGGAEHVELPEEGASLSDIEIMPVVIEPLPQMARLEL